MEPAIYQNTQLQIAALEEVVKAMPLDDMLAAIGHAETLAPILDPTLYMRGAQPLAKIKHRVEKLLAFQRLCIAEPIGA